jgi:hypothetical protein
MGFGSNKIPSRQKMDHRNMNRPPRIRNYRESKRIFLDEEKALTNFVDPDLADENLRNEGVRHIIIRVSLTYIFIV